MEIENESGVHEQSEALLCRFSEIEFLDIMLEENASASEDVLLARFEEELAIDGVSYEVKLPWEPGHTNLPDNYEQACQRLMALERLWRHRPEKRRDYTEVMRSYLESGWAGEAPANGPSRQTWHLPHHAVYQGEGLLKKCCGVVDGFTQHCSTEQAVGARAKLPDASSGDAAPFSCWLQADIEKMYLQVRFKEDDRDS
ncbi:hypothetical protein T11_16882 [Trichinella zimbabwensis]|uniref:Uncharacterized protein n=1 Tax=Trichinella zimbabwensis TaxID=268475 RepID=A0A0V1I690_9BILA|nr:hypothetical protein T11_16882 [Trichinella zimbabwensis]